MKVFHCDHCDNLVFFENSECINCKHKLGYVPEVGIMASLDPNDDNVWRSLNPEAEGMTFRPCRNYSEHEVCNWTVASDDPNPYCQSCRLTRMIPDLSQPGNREAWFALEVAKRRLICGLLSLKLPLTGKAETPEGLTFQFLANDSNGTNPVFTGHEGGVITINVAEADDAEREKRRLELHEPYRTGLGHFRHEIGHYYWNRLIEDSDQLDDYRVLFGDEREDYAKAMERHYQEGPAPKWQEQFVSAYASSHPWEDWAETWAHYLHVVDTLETAIACGMSLRPRRSDEPVLKPNVSVGGDQACSFDQMMTRWFPLTYVLNNLNRGMGLRDGYPFVLTEPVVEKLRFIHEVIGQAAVDRGRERDEVDGGPGAGSAVEAKAASALGLTR